MNELISVCPDMAAALVRANVASRERRSTTSHRQFKLAFKGRG